MSGLGWSNSHDFKVFCNGIETSVRYLRMTNCCDVVMKICFTVSKQININRSILTYQKLYLYEG